MDKDCFLQNIPSLSDDFYTKKLDEKMYRACCSGFWWFLVYVAKGIAHDQLPYAMEYLNGNLRGTINCMVDWYIGTQNNFSVLTGRHGKYLKQYLPMELYNLYTQTYSNSNYTNVWNALFIAGELFSKMASVVSEQLGFIYCHEESDCIIDYLNKIKSGCYNGGNN